MKYLIAFVVLLCGLVEGQISCMDDNGSPVDWFVILKAPDGYSYAYADSNNPTLAMSSNELNDGYVGALGSTLKQIYDNSGSSSIGYAMYNDESYNGQDKDSYGHTKGDICFDSNQGYWLVHSVPRFPDISSGYYNYPHNESIYGQSFLCMTLSSSTIDSIGTQLLINKPYIYDSNLPDSLSSSFPNVESVLSKHWEEGSPQNQTFTVTTVGNNEFVSFAKNVDWDSYLYEQFVEPHYDTGMLVESWMDGADSDKMPTFCTPSFMYNSINVREVSFPGNGPTFAETKDHSKWTVSTDKKGIVCIGDINRQYSQAKRAGGTVCQVNMDLWGSFNSLVSKSDSC